MSKRFCCGAVLVISWHALNFRRVGLTGLPTSHLGRDEEVLKLPVDRRLQAHRRVQELSPKEMISSSMRPNLLQPICG